MKNIIALDISSTATGVCVYEHKNSTAMCQTFARLTKSIKGSRSMRKDIHPFEIADQIQDFLKETNVRRSDYVIAYEQYSPGRNKKHQHIVPFFQGFLLCSLTYDRTKKPDMYEVYHSHWKMCLIGHKSTGKAFVEDRVKERCLDEDIDLIMKDEEEDSYDAFGIMYWTLNEIRENEKRKQDQE